MKKLLILIGIISLASFSGCKKESLSNQLVGTWEVRSKVGGYMIQPPYPPGNGNLLKFTDTNYQLFINGKLEKTGTYSIVKDNNSWDGAGDDRIVFDNNFNSYKEFVKMKGNSMTLYSMTHIAFDGLETNYKRQ
ncbi:MAG TPA: hypothetical protein VEV16_03120 [Daejeonella sp.]|nr:hypothetical protein [Daejeonella sp.]